MNLDEIQSLWSEDSKLDPDNLHTESTSIPTLHAKYYRILNRILLLKKSEENKFKVLKKDDTYMPDPAAKNALNEYSDATLIVYNSSFNEIVKVKFRDVFPVSLSTINFDAGAGDIDYVTADATFKYSIYDIEVMN